VGQDGEDGEGDGSGMTAAGPPGAERPADPGGPERPEGLGGPGRPGSPQGPGRPAGLQSERAFRTEIRQALRYEKGLAVKTAGTIVLVAVMLLVHFYLFR
jgi:hypothetical protein